MVCGKLFLFLFIYLLCASSRCKKCPWIFPLSNNGYVMMQRDDWHFASELETKMGWLLKANVHPLPIPLLMSMWVGNGLSLDTAFPLRLKYLTTNEMNSSLVCLDVGESYEVVIRVIATRCCCCKRIAESFSGWAGGFAELAAKTACRFYIAFLSTPWLMLEREMQYFFYEGVDMPEV